MKLLRSTADGAEVIASDWLLVEDDADLTTTSSTEEAAPAISYARYLLEKEAWHDRTSSKWTVHIEPAAELVDVTVELLALPEILISFPSYTDGRGYSHAATLTRQYDYAGTLIAVGDVRRDQLEFMRETGITAYQITGNDTVEDMVASLRELQMPAHRLYSGASV